MALWPQGFKYSGSAWRVRSRVPSLVPSTALALLCCLGLLAPTAQATSAGSEPGSRAARSGATAAPDPKARAAAGQAEARLIEIYRLVGEGRMQQALTLSRALAEGHPNFQLAQLVYGDLLSSQIRPVRALGDVPDGMAAARAAVLADLRQESALRLQALRERPPLGWVPSQFLALSPSSRHAIAVDTSRARLYLFENSARGLRLVADYYISVGKAGIDKRVEGDERTPLGVYYITSNLDPRTLPDLYGSGALPINYPNALDIKRGQTGSGIWLHGSPSDQFARAPLASEGCVVLSNPDMEHLLRTVQIRTTPVVIARQLQWVAPDLARRQAEGFKPVLQAWAEARSAGDIDRALAFYSARGPASSRRQAAAEADSALRQVSMNATSPAAPAAPGVAGEASSTAGRAAWQTRVSTDLQRVGGRALEIKDLSVLRWTDSSDTLVVTFGEVVRGQRSGLTKRLYWVREDGQWRIFSEGVVR